MEIFIEEFPEMKIAYLRKTGDYADYEGIKETWMKLFEWEDEHEIPGALPGKPPVPIGLSHDDPEKVLPEKCRFDAGEWVHESVTESYGMPVQELPAGRYACAVHLGDYKKFAGTYGEIARWIKSNSISTRQGPYLQIYLDQPGEAPPDKLRTKLCIPVK
ncbi:MAG: GyrI-like domain-containing protein [Chloroflexi bacterium]|nr:GyrI-like domain-containing protein [Chloroflexota bacterium]